MAQQDEFSVVRVELPFDIQDKLTVDIVANNIKTVNNIKLVAQEFIKLEQNVIKTLDATSVQNREFLQKLSQLAIKYRSVAELSKGQVKKIKIDVKTLIDAIQEYLVSNNDNDKKNALINLKDNIEIFCEDMQSRLNVLKKQCISEFEVVSKDVALHMNEAETNTARCKNESKKAIELNPLNQNVIADQKIKAEQEYKEKEGNKIIEEKSRDGLAVGVIGGIIAVGVLGSNPVGWGVCIGLVFNGYLNGKDSGKNEVDNKCHELSSEIDIISNENKEKIQTQITEIFEKNAQSWEIISNTLQVVKNAVDSNLDKLQAVESGSRQQIEKANEMDFDAERESKLKTKIKKWVQELKSLDQDIDNCLQDVDQIKNINKVAIQFS